MPGRDASSWIFSPGLAPTRVEDRIGTCARTSGKMSFANSSAASMFGA
jgi:hypothetical protein